MDELLVRPLAMWDYLILGFYFLLLVSIGYIFRRINRNASDYFRGGGNMVWWMAGMSAMMASISTWTFTGGAAKCYKDGMLFPLVMIAGVIPTFLILYWLAPRYRRFRVITAMEAVFRRFGTGTEQFYTWVSLPMGIFIGGVALNTLGVFMASSFRVDMPTTIIATGIVMTLLSMLGGQWAVAASSFVQGLVMFLIVFVVIFFSVNLPEIGGPTNLLQALPDRHLQFDLGARAEIVWLWIGWSIFGSFLGPMDLRASGNYVRVKDERHARHMVLLLTLPGIVILLPMLIQVPALCAAVIFPDLSVHFPHLKNPEEAAWVAMSFKVLPQGLMGVMVCGMFSAAITTLDAGLNSNAGFFVRNVYIRYVKPQANDRQQLIAGKYATLVFGGMMILIGLAFNELRTMNLFDFFQIFNALIGPAFGVPMILGLFIKRTPQWTGWSTVIVGALSATLAKNMYDAEWLRAVLGGLPLTPREVIDSQAVFIGVVNLLVSSAWFLMTMVFYKYSTAEHRERVDALFADFKRPVDRVAEGGTDQDYMQYRMVGLLCLAFGVFLLAGMLIPNPWSGRLSFLFIGGVIGGIGLVLLKVARRLAREKVVA
jgi:solute:Na+ symporter, SSS family